MTIPGPGPLNYTPNSQTPIRWVAQPRAPQSSDYKNFREGDEWLDTSSNDWWKLAQITRQTALWVRIGGTASQVESFIPDSGTSPVVPNADNEITMTGGDTIEVVGSLNTLTFETKVGGYPITPFVVGPAGQAGYQTIQSALNAANAAGTGAVYVQPGTYTENITMYDKTYLVGVTPISQIENDGTRLIGTITPPTSGHIVVRNFHLSSPTDIFTSVAAGSTHIHVIDCESAVTNGWLFNLLNWTGTLEIENYNPQSGATNDGAVNNTGGATVLIFNAGLGAGSTRTMTTSGPVIMEQGELNCPTIFGNGSVLDIQWFTFNTNVTMSGNCTGAYFASSWNTGALSSLTQSATGAVSLTDCSINSSNVNAIAGSGAGVLSLSSVNFLDSSTIASTLTVAGGVTTSGTFRTVNENTALTIVDNNINASGASANVPINLTAKGSGKIVNTTTNANIDMITGSGRVNVNNAFTLPGTDGTSGQVMTTNGAGVASWGNGVPDFVTFTAFTPTLTFGGASTGITYSTQLGSYSRIGNMVQIAITLVFTSKGSATGLSQIEGLPYDAFVESPCAVLWDKITLDAGNTEVVANVPALGLSDTTISLYETGSGIARTRLADTHFANDTSLFISLNYFTQQPI